MIENEFKLAITCEKGPFVTYIKPNPEIDLVFDAFLLMLKDIGFSEEQIDDEIKNRYLLH